MVSAFVWLLFFLGPIAEGRGPSGKEWQTLETEHFRIHHTYSHEFYARAVGASLEKHRPELEGFLLWPMPSPLDVVISDSMDAANGFAANFPNTRMVLFAVPFESDSVLSFYGNWADELALHELTHIIANDTTRGFYRPLRSIFGSWVKPNGLQPLWLIEGLAVYAETEWSPGGRGRSPFLAKLVASSHKKDSLLAPSALSIDRWNDGNPWWPGGSTPYLMGYLALAHLAKENKSWPGKLSWQNAGDFPFQPNSQLETVAGKDWHALSQELRSKLDGYSKGRTGEELCFLTRSGRETGGHALGADGWVYFSEESFERGSSLARVKAEGTCGGTEVERLAEKPWGGPSQLAVSTDGERVVYSAYRKTKGEYLWAELYEWSEKGLRRLTNEGRARDPAFLGERLFYIRQNEDLSLSIMEFKENEQHEEIFRAPSLERIAQLHGSKDRLYFSWHRNATEEKIYSLSPEKGAVPLPILPKSGPGSFERNPIVQDQNLFFSYADQKGTWQARRFHKEKNKIYGFDLQKLGIDRIVPFGKDQAIATVYHRGGFDLVRISLSDFSELQRSSGEPTMDLHQWLQEQPGAHKEEAETQDKSSWSIKPYSALRGAKNHMLPQYWLPEWNFALDGFLLGASTGGNDPLEYHSYGALAQVDSRAKFPIYQAFYLNRVNRLNWSISANQWNSYFSNSKISHRSAQYSLNGFLSLEGLWELGISGAFLERSLFGVSSQSLVFSQSVAWGEIRSTPGSVDSNEGSAFSVRASTFPNSRNEKIFYEGRVAGSMFFSGFRPSHSLGLSLNGGITTNRFLASNYFQGGGLQTVAPPDFLVRGYPSDALLGQKIGAMNGSYSLPLAQIYRGIGTLPLFLQRIGLRFSFDMGTANFLAQYERGTFRRYVPRRFGQNILTGGGLELVAKGSFFYHIPYTFVWGMHRGFQSRFGGDTQLYLAFGVGLSGARAGAQPKTEPTPD